MYSVEIQASEDIPRCLSWQHKEVLYDIMRHINPHFSYLLTYLLTNTENVTGSFLGAPCRMNDGMKYELRTTAVYSWRPRRLNVFSAPQTTTNFRQ